MRRRGCCLHQTLQQFATVTPSWHTTFNTLNFSEVEIRLGIEAAEDLDDKEAAKLVASDYGWIIVIYFIITLTRAMVVFGSLPLLNKWG